MKHWCPRYFLCVSGWLFKKVMRMAKTRDRGVCCVQVLNQSKSKLQESRASTKLSICHRVFPITLGII